VSTILSGGCEDEEGGGSREKKPRLDIEVSFEEAVVEAVVGEIRPADSDSPQTITILGGE
jgi:hypothetical protein